MSLDYIRRNYKVDARRGRPILFRPDASPPRRGVITGAVSGLLRVKFDDTGKLSSVHPTWNVIYPLVENGKQT